MARSVVARDAGTVEAEHDRFVVQTHVEVDLIERPSEEGRVDRHDGAEATHGHACCGGDGMLFGDAHIEHPTRESFGEREQTGGVGHRRGDGHEFGTGLTFLHERFGEGGGETPGLGLGGVVESLDRIVLRRTVATALLGEHVDDLRASGHRRGIAQCLLEQRDVMPVEGARIPNSEGLEERRRFERLSDGCLGGVETGLGDRSHDREIGEQLLQSRLAPHVDRVVTDLHETLSESRDGRCVRASVVVEDDDAVAAGMTEIVEALEGHTTGHGAVADDRHDASGIGSLGGLGHRQSVGPTEHGRRVAVLDPVVFGLRPHRVAGQPVGLTEVHEVLGPAGEQLVGVGLVSGVPEDDVVG